MSLVGVLRGNLAVWSAFSLEHVSSRQSNISFWNYVCWLIVPFAMRSKCFFYCFFQLACHKTVDFTTGGVHQVEENSVTVAWLITSHKTRISVTATSVSNPGKVIVSMLWHFYCSNLATSAVNFLLKQNIVQKIKRGKCPYHFIEVMACPSGIMI